MTAGAGFDVLPIDGAPLWIDVSFFDVLLFVHVLIAYIIELNTQQKTNMTKPQMRPERMEGTAPTS